MNYFLDIRPAAEAEFEEAQAMYREVGAELAQRFRETLELVLHRIQAMPLLHAAEKHDARRAHLRRFPFFLVYKVVVDKVIVVGLFHERRDPAIWQARAQESANGSE